jgi:hypothetical protein
VAVSLAPNVIKEHVMALDGHGNVQLAWIYMAGVVDSVWGARRRAGSSEFDTPRVVEDWESDSAQGLAIDFNAAGQGILTWWTASASERTLGYNYFR